MATTGMIQVTPELLRGEAKSVRSIKVDHDAQMQNLYRIVRALEGGWKGQAQDAFVANFESMKPTFEKFSKMLDEYATLMELSANSMEAKDAELASHISKTATFN